MDFPVLNLAFIEGVGGPEMLLVLVIVLVLFGGQKLPEFARGLGKSIREFKKAAAGVEEEFKRALEEDAHKTSAPPPPPPTTFPPYPPAPPQPVAAFDEPSSYSPDTPPVVPSDAPSPTPTPPAATPTETKPPPAPEEPDYHV